MLRWIPLIASLLLTSPAFAALGRGDAAPDFSAQAALGGHAFKYVLADALRKGPVVIYFYPSAFTSGCNAQAHYFAEKMDQFTAAGASVIGVSLDNVARLTEFSADPQYCAGKVPVASDADGAIALSYHLKITPGDDAFKDTRGAVIGHGFAERTTFVVDTTGKIAATIGGLAPVANVEAALAEVRRLAAGAAKR